jgi:hypothetical protein
MHRFYRVGLNCYKDRDLLQLGCYKGIRIVNVADFLEIARGEEQAR